MHFSVPVSGMGHEETSRHWHAKRRNVRCEAPAASHQKLNFRAN